MSFRKRIAKSCIQINQNNPHLGLTSTEDHDESCIQCSSQLELLTLLLEKSLSTEAEIADIKASDLKDNMSALLSMASDAEELGTRP